MAINKIKTASDILNTLQETAYCNGVYYFYNGKYYQELTDIDLQKIVRKFFIKKGMTESWSESLSKQLITAIKIEINDKKEVPLMDDYDHYIPIKNGIVDLSNLSEIKILEFNSKFLFTHCKPVEWKPTITYEEPTQFMRFLDSTFREKNGTVNEGAKELCLYICSYLIYPRNMMEKMFMFLGDGANGKSFLIDIIKLFFSSNQVSYASLQTLSHDDSNNRDFLVYSRLNIAGEQKGVKIDPEEIKKIASGQELQVIIRYKGNLVLKPKAKILVDSNTYPWFGDTTHGTKRRLSVLWFRNTFLEDDDYSEKQEIFGVKDLSSLGFYRMRNKFEMKADIEKEVNQIFNLFLLYLHRLKSRGWQLPISGESTRAMNEYEEKTDYVKVWLTKRFKVDPRKKSKIGSSYIYERFSTEYEEKTGNPPKHKRVTVTKRIQEIFRDEGVRENVSYGGMRTKDTFFNLIEIQGA